MNYNQYKLCYVQGGRWMDEDITLYFSERKAEDMWGDGWSRKPYEHNSSSPYDEDTSIELGVKDGRGIYPKISIFSVILSKQDYKGALITPCSNTDNSIYSVEDINKNKVVPWVTIEDENENKIPVWANTTFLQLKKIIEKIDCIEMYVPYKQFMLKKKKGSVDND